MIGKCKMCGQEYNTVEFSDLCISCYAREYLARRREKLEAMGIKFKKGVKL